MLSPKAMLMSVGCAGAKGHAVSFTCAVTKGSDGVCDLCCGRGLC